MLNTVEYRNTLRDLFPGADLASLDASLASRNALEPLEPSALVLERHLRLAQSVAHRVLSRARELTGCDPLASQSCAERFVVAFGSRAFRRPLSAAEAQRFSKLLRDEYPKHGPAVALQQTAVAFLLAPQFLYRLDWAKVVRVDDYALASRLAYHFWQSMPDDALFDAAASGQLRTPEGYHAEVQRLLASPRAGKAFAVSVGNWLELGRVVGEIKGPKYDAWSAHADRSALEESGRFVEHVFTSKQPTLSALLTSNYAEVDDTMAALYGVPATGAWHPVALPPAQRSGLLTRSAFLAGLSRNVSSPPLRGSLLMRRLLCEPLPPPPPNVQNAIPMPERDAPASTNRQRFERAIRASDECGGCHASMDPLGYAFENYDAVGQYQTVESGLPVDARVDVSWLGLASDVDGGVELSRQLASSPQVGYCAVTTMYRQAFRVASVGPEWCKIDAVYDAFERKGGDLRAALAAIALSPPFRGGAGAP